MTNNSAEHAANRAVYEINKFMSDDMDEVFVTIALDFDGTVVCHRYPDVGKELPHCVQILKDWVNKYKVGLILSTMRDGQELKDAVDWFAERDIPLYGIQLHPTQHTWTGSPKAHARFCLDDRNIGQPLTLDEEGVSCVDWIATNEYFEPILRKIHESVMRQRKLVKNHYYTINKDDKEKK